LIGLFTNLFYFGRWDTALVSPAGNHLGVFSVLVPIGGGQIIGLMARYGSERIRGHGIPEAMEAILINGSRVEPKVALLKPISSAISIGSGGPFGAEGLIIMIGGAFGSRIAQLFHRSSAERKTLPVAGPRRECQRRSPRRLFRCCSRSNSYCLSESLGGRAAPRPSAPGAVPFWWLRRG
jgi:H+/Cl- antiporter ClcA